MKGDSLSCALVQPHHVTVRYSSNDHAPSFYADFNLNLNHLRVSITLYHTYSEYYFQGYQMTGLDLHGAHGTHSLEA